MSATVAVPASRNAPCPCGSGLRYKECHGLLASAASAAPLELIAQARVRAEAGDFVAAAALCDKVLGQAPGHPLALRLLAWRENEAGRPLAALKLLLQASRGLPEHALPPAAAFEVWTALNGAFLDALAGLEATTAESRRDAYRCAQVARCAPDAPAPNDVTVILHVPEFATADAVAVSLESIAAQSRRPAELLVAGRDNVPALAALRGRLDQLPFGVRIIEPPEGAGIAAALDAATIAARTPFVVALDPPDAFGEFHLETLVDAVAKRGAQWGFTDCEHVAFGDVPPDVLDARRAAGDATRTTIARADSVGMAFIDQTFAAAGMGAVAFTRALHASLGGFRPLSGHEMWDFAVRAMWLDEPVHVPRATYRHAVTQPAPEITPAQRESAQLAIYRDYYSRACRADAQSPNPFAPSVANWGLQFVRRMFQCGHVLMVSLDALEALAERIATAAADKQPLTLTPGINLLGFAFGEFGLGESLRGLARACQTGAIPFVVNDIDTHLGTRQADRSVAHHLCDDLRHRLSLMCVNPDMLEPVRRLLARTREAGGRNAGYWYWELETIPRTWERGFDAVDEIWCATDFVANAVRRATALPVFKVPPPIEVELARSYSRDDFGLPAHPFLFLFTFDYNSFVKRKNPEAVIAAFQSAFAPGRDDVGLVVKSVNGARRPDRVAAIRALIGDDPRIIHIDRFLSRDESYGLTAVTDAYVSLHRAEGLGLGLAEAMSLGKPVVGTAYSGNLEFMREDNSLLVDYRVVPIPPGDYLVDDARFVWADPDVDAAARHMRRLVDDPALRMRLASAGQQDIRSRFSRERSAELIRARLAELDMLVADPRPRLNPPIPASKSASTDSPAVACAAAYVAAAQEHPAESRFDPNAVPFLDLDAPEPTLSAPASQLCTLGQFAEPVYAAWCERLREPASIHRKQWEFVYILQVLELAGCLGPGRRGLGFGCGREPLVAVMAMRGCEVLATDLDAATAAGQGWIETGQHARALDDLNDRGICAPALFGERVAFRAQDMNRIDPDLTGFDFVWSSCSFEHLGSIRHGLAFVDRAMRCLRPGGVAVHTTEFNLSSNGSTVESPTLSVFRRRDIEQLASDLRRNGHRVWPLNLQPGRHAVDRHVDLPPYRDEPHLKLQLGRYVITSLGIVIERGTA